MEARDFHPYATLSPLKELDVRLEPFTEKLSAMEVEKAAHDKTVGKLRKNLNKALTGCDRMKVKLLAAEKYINVRFSLYSCLWLLVFVIDFEVPRRQA